MIVCFLSAPMFWIHPHGFNILLTSGSWRIETYPCPRPLDIFRQRCCRHRLMGWLQQPADFVLGMQLWMCAFLTQACLQINPLECKIGRSTMAKLHRYRPQIETILETLLHAASMGQWNSGCLNLRNQWLHMAGVWWFEDLFKQELININVGTKGYHGKELRFPDLET